MRYLSYNYDAFRMVLLKSMKLIENKTKITYIGFYYNFKPTFPMESYKIYMKIKIIIKLTQSYSLKFLLNLLSS